ncbi:MAG: hypothetical protein ACRDNS_27470, partial [Trebonia sp.]
MDSGAWTSCTSPYTTATLGDGDHTFAVRATDAVGNTDPTPAAVSFHVVHDSDGDGTPDSQDCAPNDPSIHPGAADTPDLGFVDSNCDGIDGDVTKAIFVSPNGSDSNVGETPGTPKRTITSAIALAESPLGAGRTQILVAAGTYNESLTISAPGIGIYGGYDPTTWKRSRGAVTEIIGSPQALLLQGTGGTTELQLVKLVGEPLGVTGSSAYGLRAVGSTAILDTDTITADHGAAGISGQPGQNGPNGANGEYGFLGNIDGPGGCGAGDTVQYAAGAVPGQARRFDDTCITGPVSPLTPTGTGPGYAVPGGLGGNGGFGAIQEHSGAAPQAGTGGSGAHPGDGGIFTDPGCPAFVSCGSPAGDPGGQGSSGAAGSNGAGSSGEATTGGDLEWNSATGKPGSPGEPGSGGGGGSGAPAGSCFTCT